MNLYDYAKACPVAYFTGEQLVNAVEDEKRRWQRWACLNLGKDRPCDPSDQDWKPCELCSGPL